MPEKGGNKKVNCGLCHRDVPGLIYLKVYTSKGIKVCEGCYKDVNNHRNQPYSKVMERLAMVEAGYHANRKRAKLRTI